jgi:hypothetical protein
MALRGKKKDFKIAFQKTFGNISQSCMSVGVVRQTYYDWRRNDAAFSKEIDDLDILEAEKDMIEAKLRKHAAIHEDKTVLMFLAKTKCRDRGYVERTETEITVPQVVINETRNYKEPKPD